MTHFFISGSRLALSGSQHPVKYISKMNIRREISIMSGGRSLERPLLENNEEHKREQQRRKYRPSPKSLRDEIFDKRLLQFMLASVFVGSGIYYAKSIRRIKNKMMNQAEEKNNESEALVPELYQKQLNFIPSEEKKNQLRKWLPGFVVKANSAIETNSSTSSQQRTESKNEGKEEEEIDLSDFSILSSDGKIMSEADIRKARIQKNEQEYLDFYMKNLSQTKLALESPLGRRGKQKEEKEYFDDFKFVTKDTLKDKNDVLNVYVEILDKVFKNNSRKMGSGVVNKNELTSHSLPVVLVVGDVESDKRSLVERLCNVKLFSKDNIGRYRGPIRIILSKGDKRTARFVTANHTDTNKKYDISNKGELEKFRRLMRDELYFYQGRRYQEAQTELTIHLTGPDLTEVVLIDLPSFKEYNMTFEAESISSDVKAYLSNPNSIILHVQNCTPAETEHTSTEFVTKYDPTGKRTIGIFTNFYKTPGETVSSWDVESLEPIIQNNIYKSKASKNHIMITNSNPDVTLETLSDIERFCFNDTVVKSFFKNLECTPEALRADISELFLKKVDASLNEHKSSLSKRKRELVKEYLSLYPHSTIQDTKNLLEASRKYILQHLKFVDFDQLVKNIFSSTHHQTLESFLEIIYLEHFVGQLNGESGKPHIKVAVGNWAAHKHEIFSIALYRAVLHLIRAFDESTEVKGVDKNKMEVLTSKIIEAVLSETSSPFVTSIRRDYHKADISREMFDLENLENKDQFYYRGLNMFRESITKLLERYERALGDAVGSRRITQIFYPNSKEQNINKEIKNELDKILYNNPNHSRVLMEDEFKCIIDKLHSQCHSADIYRIHRMWRLVYRTHILHKAMKRLHYCESNDPHTNQPHYDVMMFHLVGHFLQQVSTTTANHLVKTEENWNSAINSVLRDSEFLKDFKDVKLCEEITAITNIETMIDHYQKLKEEKNRSDKKKFEENGGFVMI